MKPTSPRIEVITRTLKLGKKDIEIQRKIGKLTFPVIFVFSHYQIWDKYEPKISGTDVIRK